jgi:hypothetical protein
VFDHRKSTEALGGSNGWIETGGLLLPVPVPASKSRVVGHRSEVLGQEVPEPLHRAIRELLTRYHSRVGIFSRSILLST